MISFEGNWELKGEWKIGKFGSDTLPHVSELAGTVLGKGNN